MKQPQPIIKPVKPSKLPLIILSLLLVFSLGISAFLFYQNQQLQNQVTLITTKLQIGEAINPLPSPEPILSWNTYSNPQLGYSLQYPMHWNIEPMEGVEGSVDVVHSSADNVRLTIIRNPPTLTSTCFTPITIGDSTMWFDNHIAKKMKYDIVSDEAVGGECMGNKPFERLIQIEWNQENTPYQLRFRYDHRREAEMTKILSQILSTFKFTDSTTDTSTWKTYTNSNFSFNYPPTLKLTTSAETINLSGREGTCPGDGSGNPNISSSDVNEFTLTMRIHQGQNFDSISRSVHPEIQGNPDSSYELDSHTGYVFYQGAEMMAPRNAYLIKMNDTQALEIDSYKLDRDPAYCNPSDLNPRQYDIDQILSTFKFTQ